MSHDQPDTAACTECGHTPAPLDDDSIDAAIETLRAALGDTPGASRAH